MKLSDVVNRINGNVDRFTTDLEYYIGGEHMESNELEITKGGNLKENLGKLEFFNNKDYLSDYFTLKIFKVIKNWFDK